MQIRALVLSMAAVMGVGGANAQTASVNFDTPALAVAPQSAVLSNGVTWSVNAGGPWDFITGTLAGGIPYAHYNVGATRVQTWTFREGLHKSAPDVLGELTRRENESHETSGPGPEPDDKAHAQARVLGGDGARRALGCAGGPDCALRS